MAASGFHLAQGEVSGTREANDVVCHARSAAWIEGPRAVVAILYNTFGVMVVGRSDPV